MSYSTSSDQQWEPIIWTKQKPVIKPTPPKPKEEDEQKPKLGLKCAQQIIQTRVNKKWTQQQLAQALKLDLAVLKKYEKGDIIPNRSILNSMNKVLAIKIDY